MIRNARSDPTRPPPCGRETTSLAGSRRLATSKAQLRSTRIYWPISNEYWEPCSRHVQDEKQPRKHAREGRAAHHCHRAARPALARPSTRARRQTIRSLQRQAGPSIIGAGDSEAAARAPETAQPHNRGSRGQRPLDGSSVLRMHTMTPAGCPGETPALVPCATADHRPSGFRIGTPAANVIAGFADYRLGGIAGVSMPARASLYLARSKARCEPCAAGAAVFPAETLRRQPRTPLHRRPTESPGTPAS